MPKVYEHGIIDCLILDEASQQKAGTILEQNEVGMRLATIDYDIFLYYDRFEELLEACRNGNLSVVKKICEVSKHVHDRSEQGWTPLIVATYNGHIDIVQYLISIGANIHDKNYNGTNLLMYAKEEYLRSGDSRLFNLFLEMGLKPDEVDNVGKNVIDYLKEDGYTVNDILV